MNNLPIPLPIPLHKIAEEVSRIKAAYIEGQKTRSVTPRRSGPMKAITKRQNERIKRIAYLESLRGANT